MNDVESDFSLDEQDFQEKFGVPKPSLDSHELVFHCQMGRRGGLATEKARSLGFSKYDQNKMLSCQQLIQSVYKKEVILVQTYFS